MNLLILGVPNVGKTSLYNLISEDNKNIIHKTIGTTRDWHVSSLKQNKNINIYDTPGIIIKNNNIEKNFLELINRIDIFLYVIDYKNKNYVNDYELIRLFRKFNKEIVLIVNKDDNLNQDKNLFSFGIKNIFYISCAHKLGFDDFLFFYQNLNQKIKYKKKLIILLLYLVKLMWVKVHF